VNRAIANLDQTTLENIHAYSLDLLGTTGIRFPSEMALVEFKKHGLRVEGETVFFSEVDIRSALDSAPQSFTIHARNPEKSIRVGGTHYVMAPGYGPPFIIAPTGEKRDALLDDVFKFCKLVQTSKHLDFNSSLVVQPNDVPAGTSHLDVLLATLTLTDKPIMGSSASLEAARDSLKLAEMVWENLGRPVMISLVNSLSPLQYAREMIEALMAFAEAGQPVIIHSASSLGSSGPITLAGSLVISNATTLAGICLAQLLRPGTPVVYGLGGSPTDMQSGGYINASPEDVKHTALAAAMGRYYGLPSRGQGALTESFSLDYQAGMESAMLLTSAGLSGVNVAIHACGTYGSMLAMSYEKFLADEDLVGAVKKVIQPMELTEDAFALDMVKELGISGKYLTQDHTFERCRSEFFIPDLGIRTHHDNWLAMERREITLRAGRLLKTRLASYEKPFMAPGLEARLRDFVNHRKTGG
jgi:trimethylamine:corrinoid methyltransferase-like protein